MAKRQRPVVPEESQATRSMNQKEKGEESGGRILKNYARYAIKISVSISLFRH